MAVKDALKGTAFKVPFCLKLSPVLYKCKVPFSYQAFGVYEGDKHLVSNNARYGGVGELKAHVEHPQTLVCDKNVKAEGILRPHIGL